MTTEPEAPSEPAARSPRRARRVAALWLTLGALMLGAVVWWSVPRARETSAPAPDAPQQSLARVHAHVVGPAGEALSGAHVRAVGDGDARTDNVTDAEGRTQLTVPVGPVTLEVSHAGFARTLARAETTSTEPLRIDIKLGPERILEGRVLDDRGDRLASVRVHVESIDQPEMSPWEVQSDTDGQFRIVGLPRDELLVEATLPGHDGSEHVLPKTHEAPVALVLPRQGELLVALQDAQGKPVPDAELLLTGTGLWPAAEARTNAQGEHLFESLVAGQYRARARKGADIALPSLPMNVVPGARTQLALRLVPGARACGRVFDGSTRGPLAGARVTVYDLTPGLPARSLNSEADGSFEVLGLWPGSVRIEVAHEGYAPTAVEAVLPSADCAPIALDGAATLEGQVVDERGQPVAGALLSVSTRDGLPVLLGAPSAREGLAGSGELGVTRGPVPRIPAQGPGTFAMGSLAAESAANGAFRIVGLSPTALVLSVARAGYAPNMVEVLDLAPHSTKSDLRIVLREAGRVEGRVTDRRGKGVAGVYVSAHALQGMEQSTLSDARGDFVIEDVIGDVTVEATPAGYAPVTCQVVVQPGASARCALALENAMYELPVRVVDELGFGLEGALVVARKSGSERRSSQLTREDGRALVRELPEPPYLVDVTLSGHLSAVDRPATSVDREVQVSLPRASAIRGVVLDGLGRPVNGAFVSTDEGDASAETDVTGGFALESVAPGALSLWARHPRAGKGQSAEVRARPGETLSNVRIVLDGRYVPSADDAVKGEHASSPRPSAPRATANTASSSARARAAAKPSEYSLEQRGPRVLVTAVAAGTNAARAGLRAGDVLLSVDRENVFSAAQARGMLRHPPNTVAVARVEREGRTLSLRLRRPPL